MSFFCHISLHSSLKHTYLKSLTALESTHFFYYTLPKNNINVIVCTPDLVYLPSSPSQCGSFSSAVLSLVSCTWSPPCLDHVISSMSSPHAPMLLPQSPIPFYIYGWITGTIKIICSPKSSQPTKTHSFESFLSFFFACSFWWQLYFIMCHGLAHITSNCVFL